MLQISNHVEVLLWIKIYLEIQIKIFKNKFSKMNKIPKHKKHIINLLN